MVWYNQVAKQNQPYQRRTSHEHTITRSSEKASSSETRKKKRTKFCSADVRCQPVKRKTMRKTLRWDMAIIKRAVTPAAWTPEAAQRSRRDAHLQSILEQVRAVRLGWGIRRSQEQGIHAKSQRNDLCSEAIGACGEDQKESRQADQQTLPRTARTVRKGAN